MITNCQQDSVDLSWLSESASISLSESDVLKPSDYLWYVYSYPLKPFRIPAEKSAVRSVHGFSLYFSTIFGVSKKRHTRRIDDSVLASRYVRYFNKKYQCLLYNIPEDFLATLFTFTSTSINTVNKRLVKPLPNDYTFDIQPSGVYSSFEYVIGSDTEKSQKKLPDILQQDSNTGTSEKSEEDTWRRYSSDTPVSRVSKSDKKIFTIKKGDLFDVSLTGYDDLGSVPKFAELTYSNKTRLIFKHEYESLIANSHYVNTKKSGPLDLITNKAYPSTVYVYDSKIDLTIKPTSYLYPVNTKGHFTFLTKKVGISDATHYRLTKLPDTFRTSSEYGLVEVKSFNDVLKNTVFSKVFIVTESDYKVLESAGIANTSVTIFYELSRYLDLEAVPYSDDFLDKFITNTADFFSKKVKVKIQAKNVVSVTPSWANFDLAYIKVLALDPVTKSEYTQLFSGVISQADASVIRRSSKVFDSTVLSENQNKLDKNTTEKQEDVTVLNKDKQTIFNPLHSKNVELLPDKEKLFLENRHDEFTHKVTHLSEDKTDHHVLRLINKNLSKIESFISADSLNSSDLSSDTLNTPNTVYDISPNSYTDDMKNIALFVNASKIESDVRNRKNEVSELMYMLDSTLPLPLSSKQVTEELNYNQRLYFDDVEQQKTNNRILVPKNQHGQQAIDARAKIWKDKVEASYRAVLSTDDFSGMTPIGNNRYILPIVVNTDKFGDSRKVWVIIHDANLSAKSFRVIKYIGLDDILYKEGLSTSIVKKLGFSDRFSQNTASLVKKMTQILEQPDVVYPNRKVKKESENWEFLCNGTFSDYDKEHKDMARSIYYSGTKIEYTKKGTVADQDRQKVFKTFVDTIGSTQEQSVRIGNVIKFDSNIVSPSLYREASSLNIYTQQELDQMRGNFLEGKIDVDSYYVLLGFDDESIYDSATSEYVHKAVYYLCNMRYAHLIYAHNKGLVSISSADSYVTLKFKACLQYTKKLSKSEKSNGALLDIFDSIADYSTLDWYMYTGMPVSVKDYRNIDCEFKIGDVYGISKLVDDWIPVVRKIADDAYEGFLITENNVKKVKESSWKCVKYTHTDSIERVTDGNVEFVIEEDDLVALNSDTKQVMIGNEVYDIRPTELKNLLKFSDTPKIGDTESLILDKKSSNVKKQDFFKKELLPLYIDKYVDVSLSNSLLKSTENSDQSSYNQVFLNKNLFTILND